MGSILIAGRSYDLPDDVPVTTWRDRDGLSFYELDGRRTVSRRFVGEDGQSMPYVSPRHFPSGTSAQPGLAGEGWGSVGDGDPVKTLRQVVRAIVIHHDAAGDSRACFDTLINRGFSTHFMIDRDGHVFQSADPADKAFHATVMNPLAIGIDLNNPAPNLLAETSEPVDPAEISPEMAINGVRYRSINYTDDQYRSLSALLRVLTAELNIPPVFPVDQSGRILAEVITNPPVYQFRGLLCHWHVQAEKWDPGPGFDWRRIVSELRKEDCGFPVGIEFPVWMSPKLPKITGSSHLDRSEKIRAILNSALSSEATADVACEDVFRAIENGDGGFYPMGVNQTWHGGVHFPAPLGARVRPMLSGELVAARFVDRDRFVDGLSSPNFVLLRHRIPMPPRRADTRLSGAMDGPRESDALATVTDRFVTVFSLYMHLAPLDWNRPSEMDLIANLQRRQGHGHLPNPPDGAMPKVITPDSCPDQVAALRQGYVGLFSPEDDPDSAIRVTPQDVIGLVDCAGDESAPYVHVEVFGDERMFEAMEMSLYGKYLTIGPMDQSPDLVVRDRRITSLVAGQSVKRIAVLAPGSRKTLAPNDIRRFMADGYEGDRAVLRKLIVGHLSEWSSDVEWVNVLVSMQDWVARRDVVLGGLDSGPSQMFRHELARFMPFAWMGPEVVSHLGLVNGPNVLTIHPVSFLLWWAFRRFAVRKDGVSGVLKASGRERRSLLERAINVYQDLVMP